MSEESRPQELSVPERGTRRGVGRVAIPWIVLVVWFFVQFTLIGTARLRPDGSYAYRMFPESSDTYVTLFREVDEPAGRRTVPAKGGQWEAHDKTGKLVPFTWKNYVFRQEVSTWDQWMHAGYGLGAQRDRWQHAVDFVSKRTEDVDTRRFLVRIQTRRNGKEGETYSLHGPERPAP